MTPAKKGRVLPFEKPGSPTPAPDAPKAEKTPKKGEVNYSDRAAFVGMRQSADGSKEWAVFVKLTETEREGLYLPADVPSDRLLHYEAKMARQLAACRAGAIYACIISKEGGIQYQRRAMPVGYVHDDTRFAWQAINAGVEKSIAARKSTEKESKRDLLEERCEPLRRAYQRCPTGMAKQQLLAEIVFRVTRQR